LYTRINENLKLTLLIHFVKTITGSIYKITLPSQEILTLNTKDFNEIINPTKLFILKNKGMPVYNIESKSIISYGDLFIQFNVIYGKLKSNISNDDIAKIEHFFSKIYEEIDASQNNNIKIINDLLL
jgi:DnaJ-class molecular chaperone